MAGFKTHITTSTVLGVGYGAAGFIGGASLDTALLATGLCSVAGMLPDIDSATGRPLKESIAFAAAVTPMLMINRMMTLGMSTTAIALVGALIYLFIRFGVGEFMRRYTVHRGMFHSVPGALVATLLAYLICESGDTNLRMYKAGAVLAGYLSHLMLDELYSIEWYRGRLRLKKSFGTAMKLWGRNLWGNLSVYVKLILVGFLAFGDPYLMDRFYQQSHELIDRGAEASKVARGAIRDAIRR